MAPLDRRAFENLHPGRRFAFDLPVSDHETVSFTVLDSITEGDHEVACAAILVPTGAEGDWMYSSEGGQWQLLATAAVSRMIIVSRISGQIRTEGFGDESEACLQCEDEALKSRLGATVVALAPRICFTSGIPVVPFVDYTNNVIHRVVIEESFSSLTGSMVVEDVALGTELLESESVVGLEGETECAHRIVRTRELDRVLYRRRLRFKRMPNLIQTEVPLVVPQDLTIARETTGIDKESVGAFCEEVMKGSQIDHGILVHKYLPPIVAGLVLAASCIEPCMERGERVKVLALGVGGGALPIFLQKHLGFHVQAVDVDRVVLDLAHRHFGLKNGVDMEVEVGDALQIVGKLAMKVIAEDARLKSENLADASPKSMKGSFGSSISTVEGEDVLTPPCSTQNAVAPSLDSIHDVCQVNGSKRGFDDHRVHVIVVDVDEGDARCGLSSPPSSFLEHGFLSAARTVLHDGGLLAINVVPNGANSYCGVVSSLLSVFDDVYETAVEGDVNRVVFALPSKGAGAKLDGPLATLVKRFLDVRLTSRIQKAHTQS